MTTAAPTRQQILRLYRRYLSTSQSFASYNFRTYFLRRSRDMFRSALLPASEATTASPFSKAASVTAPVVPASLVHAPISTPAGASPFGTSLAASLQHKESSSGTPEERLAAFYERASAELDALRRAAVVNRLYQGERLVVEEPRLIIGGGGSGAEASVGGGGQPV
ncbi:unnamed protein product [Tilletia controversa]|uniref:Complex 1 LYR protein domain-containing protein n=3 Tax=Tilletia TaxID=13289 RepID=A0A8X7MV54_9BASI|nr:hypothetical protein CF328_g4752 [Tilletia controversa]KAE8197606.1 hypothetical protein CF336_g2075 [Tilletia laevis]KAE8263523.1 hypothetical protein A4X03_0g1620 [Tilletia caries]KAE8207085.1 hypothetical protein CF335_g1405 [Tilletia laevis]KAE8248775.1 hypothetical protein A4X06_0g3531 [Tilletia controversa]